MLICGMTGVALATFAFGLSSSESFWQVLLFRAMAGAWSGNVA